MEIYLLPQIHFNFNAFTIIAHKIHGNSDSFRFPSFGEAERLEMDKTGDGFSADSSLFRKHRHSLSLVLVCFNEGES